MVKHEKGVKRFGVRYGRTIKNKLGKIEANQKKEHKCPTCQYNTVSRLAAGIWQCSKCNLKFTSRAYTVTAPPQMRSEQSKEV